MADIKISALPLSQALDGSELVPLVKGGVTVRGTVNQVVAPALSRASHTGSQAISTVTGLQAALDAKLALGASATSAIALAAGSDRDKLDSIATGATQNAPDAALRDRSTHTGSQPISSITGLQAAIDLKAPLASPTFTGTVSGSFVGDLQGNASTATALASGSADRIKLDGLTSGTVNSSDAFLLSRANHTGTQGLQTIGGLQEALDLKAPLASPTFTGTASGAFSGNLSGIASSAVTLAPGADRDKLDGIADYATANASDNILRDRSNHTGTQSSTTITVSASGRLIGRSTSGSGAAEEIALGEGLALDAGTLTVTFPEAPDTGSGPVAWADITGKPTLSAVALSGSYVDLNDLPYEGMNPPLNELPDVHVGTPTALAQDHILTYIASGQVWVNKALDTVFGTGTNGQIVTRVAGKPQWANVPAVSWSAVTDKPTYAPVATTGAYGDLTGAPVLAPVATTGSYLDLTDVPVIEPGDPGLASVSADGAPVLGGDLEVSDKVIKSSVGGILMRTAGNEGFPNGGIFFEGYRLNFWNADNVKGPNYDAVLEDYRPEVNINADGDNDIRVSTNGAIVLEGGKGVEVAGLGYLMGKPDNFLGITNKNGALLIGGSPGGPAANDAPAEFQIIGAPKFDGTPEFHNRVIQTGPTAGHEVVDARYFGQTTGGTPVALSNEVPNWYYHAYTPMTIATGRAATFQILLTGLRTDVAGDIASFVISGLVRNSDGTASIVAQAQQVIHRTDDDWIANAVAEGDQLKIYVAGSAGETVKWTAAVRLSFVG
jgi:hypothetical protein